MTRSKQSNRKGTPPSDYEVGYKRPPRSAQFKPGQSGNPSGRAKKKNKSVAETFESILSEVIPVKREGKNQRITKLEALLHTLIKKASEGDQRSLQTIFKLMRELDLPLVPEKQYAVAHFPPRAKTMEEWQENRRRFSSDRKDKDEN